MKINGQTLLLEVLKNPTTVQYFTPDYLDLLLRQGRAANLLAHLHWVFVDMGLEGDLPEEFWFHLNSSALIAKRHAQTVAWEVSILHEALFDLGVPIVLLKGAAYILAGLPISRGRLFNDIDIMVPRSAISEVEMRLLRWGWRSAHNSLYDQKYYRTWMHEIPPLKHSTRQTVLDIHHSILPLTSKLAVDAGKLLADSVTDQSREDVYWLQPVDMVLHSAAHLFSNGEFENGLRDLIDLDLLLKHYSISNPDFYCQLFERAKKMGLSRPLYYALRYCKALLSTAVDEDILLQVQGQEFSANRTPIRDWLFQRALLPMHSSCSQPGTEVARFMLYVRAHYLRMPLRLLIPHLLHKAIADKDKPFPKELQRFIDKSGS